MNVDNKDEYVTDVENINGALEEKLRETLSELVEAEKDKAKLVNIQGRYYDLLIDLKRVVVSEHDSKPHTSKTIGDVIAMHADFSKSDDLSVRESHFIPESQRDLEKEAREDPLVDVKKNGVYKIDALEELVNKYILDLETLRVRE